MKLQMTMVLLAVFTQAPVAWAARAEVGVQIRIAAPHTSVRVPLPVASPQKNSATAESRERKSAAVVLPVAPPAISNLTLIYE